MGLDAVELVMFTEERFGIRISDEEATPIRTPRMLIDLVCSKIPSSENAGCQTQQSFYLLRRELTRITGAERSKIRPESAVRSFLGIKREKVFWQELQTSVQAVSWPALQLHPKVEIARNAGLTLLWIGATLSFWRAGESWTSGQGMLSLIGGFCTVWLAGKLLARPIRRYEQFIPRKIKKLGDLLPSVATSPEVRWSRASVAAIVEEIVTEVLDLDEGQYRENADFVKDLGLS